jgi:hypothetical protein
MGKAYQFYDPMQTREFQQGYYIRDNWQVTRRLSFNVGMRFEHFPIMNRGEFGIERYDPETNQVLIGGRVTFPGTPGPMRSQSCSRPASAWPTVSGKKPSFAPASGSPTILIP